MNRLTPPTPLWAASQGELRDTDALVKARLWLASRAWGLLVLGAVGRGKSMAAAWLWHRLREEAIAAAGRPVGEVDGRPIYHRAGEVIWLRARQLQRMSWDDRAEVLQRCADAYGLIVDEMGGENQGTAEAIGDVVEERGDHQRRTVMTTNLPKKGAGSFLERYGDRMVSRLRSGGLNEAGLAEWAVDIDGTDLRGVVVPVEADAAVDEPPVSAEDQQRILDEMKAVARRVRG